MPAAFDGPEAFAAAWRAAGQTLRMCVRGTTAGRGAGDLGAACEALGFAAALARDVSAAACGAAREALVAALGAALPAHAGLAGLRWRVDVVLSSAGVSKVMRSVLICELTLTSGRVVTMEVPAERFHELRYSVAKGLLDMGALESHPVLRIV
jgi:hypothetical protein